MASARVEIVQPEPPPRKVILELTEEEAGALFAIMGNIAGNGTMRKPADAMYHALRSLFSVDFPSPFIGGVVLREDAEPAKLKP